MTHNNQLLFSDNQLVFSDGEHLLYGGRPLLYGGDACQCCKVRLLGGENP